MLSFDSPGAQAHGVAVVQKTTNVETGNPNSGLKNHGVPQTVLNSFHWKIELNWNYTWISLFISPFVPSHFSHCLVGYHLVISQINHVTLWLFNIAMENPL